MPGPLPKSPELRQRRNKSTTHAMLPAESQSRRKPRLPTHPEGDEWHAMARRWWHDVWSSPMSYEFLRGDEPAIFRLVVLVDQFWRTGALEVAREIRLLEREFGLTPLSRRRLEWTVVRSEEAQLRRSKRSRIINGQAVDPRQALESE